ncbi:unnamed protein product, partial [Schistosoma curassoni]|uniref:Transposase n=1 Tax=Schistosoma curassoni TaxID=6186 RepID=A0A183KSY1_9TREM
RKISIAKLTCGFTEASDNLRNEPEPKVSTIHRFLDSIFQSDKLCGQCNFIQHSARRNHRRGFLG